ncbi:uncharacterized protein PAC_00638 [Phialocephala subalpina]|jgi:plastocyanin|uniref:Uncharacterized protein n=1 Tax=Phialocephala subalpina TaxID=576137 RepID=A0A1L7WDA6_9HELO|nr:uncharacterized protein PAC_00638 [Phialocephala subalpina]
MKFSNVATLGSIFALASASSHVQEVAVTCTDADPTTVYQTVTVTSTVYNCGGNNNQQYTSALVSQLTAHTLVGSSSVTSYSAASRSTSIPPPPPATTSSKTTSLAPRATHNVVVGANGDLIYGPNQLNAAIGDIIHFDFNSTNHTVTQSSFNAPCEPLAGGFNTGFNQVNKLNHTGVIFVDYEVKTDSPLWFYCAQTVKTSHCHKGMVLGVNPGTKFPAFLSVATQTATTMPLSTGGSKVTSSAIYGTGSSSSKTTMSMSTGTGVSKSSSTSKVSMSLSTGYTMSPKPTATISAYRLKGRKAADWYN